MIPFFCWRLRFEVCLIQWRWSSVSFLDKIPDLVAYCRNLTFERGHVGARHVGADIWARGHLGAKTFGRKDIWAQDIWTRNALQPTFYNHLSPFLEKNY